MRPVPALAVPGPTASTDQKVDWCVDMIRRICDASRDEGTDITRPYQLANLTATRRLDPTTATLPQVANVLGSLISDMKKGGMNRVG